ncbi:MAG: ATP-binding protein [Wenzhouxiangella sp.]|jgi:two-component system sensor histidine kinase FlrB|nr:ATP-binding protein [Wenzhouxiangella sp.]
MTKDPESDQSRLESAFAAFNQLSEQLSGAYRDLEQRAAGLAEELARSRHEKERQRAEKERLAERLETLLDSLPGGVLVVDRAGCIRQSNAPAREWLGRALNGSRWQAVLAEADLNLSDDGRELTVGGCTQLTVARSRVAARGETIILLTDVTEQRRLAAELDQNRRLAAMGEMAARLAHQVRTPLSAALLYADHLTTRELDSDQRERFGDRLMSRLRDLERMTRDMLGFVRGGCRQSDPVALEDLLGRLEESLAGTVPEGSRLCIDHGGVRGVVQGDAQGLLGALCNLVENAWNAGGAGVAVTVQLRLKGASVVEIWVMDDGPGVPDELADRLFEPFVSGRPGGTGLGLAVAASVAEAHGGGLRLVQSAAPGACFVLRLPLVGRRIQHTSEAAA